MCSSLRRELNATAHSLFPTQICVNFLLFTAAHTTPKAEICAYLNRKISLARGTTNFAQCNFLVNFKSDTMTWIRIL